MPRVRSIKPEHWSDKSLPKISLGAHLLWVGMWNFSDDKGVIENDANLMKSNIFPRRKDVKPSHINKWVNELIKELFVIPFEFKDIQFLIHRTFDIHQRIDKPQPSKIPDDIIIGLIGERSKNGIGIISEQSRLERRGEERSRKGVGEEGSNSGIVISDIEKYLQEHEKEFEIICMAANKSKEEVAPVLKKYHLWNQDKEYYPKAPLALIAGLKRWIINEKTFTNGTHKPTSSRNDKSAGAKQLIDSLKSDLQTGA